MQGPLSCAQPCPISTRPGTQRHRGQRLNQREFFAARARISRVTEFASRSLPGARSQRTIAFSSVVAGPKLWKRLAGFANNPACLGNHPRTSSMCVLLQNPNLPLFCRFSLASIAHHELHGSDGYRVDSTLGGQKLAFWSRQSVSSVFGPFFPIRAIRAIRGLGRARSRLGLSKSGPHFAPNSERDITRKD